ncbi:DEAD/DEAH box helicase family protein [Carnobacterium sp. ISL-102]|uniref:DEAD/DEAH box helicase n=1 Tax=Carnobacterium sp. ISL-102 TaxID=2819142 RepID=UPI001BE9B17C|nr:DEAD/DEAH box helicase family protein [Carnobacterium sp. ISL-102]MBT2733137.1 DEAD/DEAH box helicase family protein [Carnobacterium sp. ISL-102]
MGVRYPRQEIIDLGNGNRMSKSYDEQGNGYSYGDTIASWKKGYTELVSRNKGEIGLRLPQFGALSAIRAHWATSNVPATVVLPTGTGKSETMFATIISEQIGSTLIIVPSNLLREQIFEGCSHFGILPKLGMIDYNVIYPTTFLYKGKFKDEQKLRKAIDSSNIIISTPGMIKNMTPEILEIIINKIEVVIFDEAHHLGAPDWQSVRDNFLNKRILQFTATPFRNDGKKIAGKIIFNYGLGLAQNAGYFKKIEFYPIQEFDENKSDIEIANVALEKLRGDLNDGFNHVILARANSTKRANELFEKIYSKYNEFNPVVIHSKIKTLERRESLQKVKNGESKIVVCVDMFGEGIDIPTLKIAAIHDKYKSLPITLQFIGRFARTSGENLGDAKLITNVAMDDLREAVEELYHQDSDWNRLLNIHSSQSIESEVNLGEFIESFEKGHADTIDLSQLKMKVSTRMFRYHSTKIEFDNWKKVLNPERTTSLMNDKDSVYIFIEEIESKVVWSDQKDIVQYEYDFFVLFFDKENGIVHINETDTGKGNRLVEKMFFGANQIKGDSIYRVLNGINRLMIGTLGLKQVPNGRVSFRMFAGTDIKSGISEAASSSSIKSNLFGYGFKDGNRISIGCSYKGKVWMRWVERVDFWIEWCKETGKQVLDVTIDTKNILENSLVSEAITSFPKGKPYKITLPEQIEVSNSISKQLYIKKEDLNIPLFQASLSNPEIVANNLVFEYWVNDRKFMFEQFITDTNYGFQQIEGDELFVKKNNQLISMTDYFKEYSPEISFIQEKGIVAVVQENLKTIIKPKKDMTLNPEYINIINWDRLGVNIKKESQGREKRSDSIQYATIHNIIDSNSDIIFDDDGSGEIADIVSVIINQEQRNIDFHLYHCKYSHGDNPRARVSDLYEVCGQAEKSIMWNDNTLELVIRMIEREKQQNKKYNTTRFDKGDLKTLHMLKKMIQAGFQTKFMISVVQPGVSIKSITPAMKQILFASDSFLTDTYGIKLCCYFSE